MKCNKIVHFAVDVTKKGMGNGGWGMGEWGKGNGESPGGTPIYKLYGYVPHFRNRVWFSSCLSLK